MTAVTSFIQVLDHHRDEIGLQALFQLWIEIKPTHIILVNENPKDLCNALLEEWLVVSNLNDFAGHLIPSPFIDAGTAQQDMPCEINDLCF